MNEEIITQNDTAFMRRALELTEEASKVGEVPVGALLVSEGEIIAESFNHVESLPSVLEHAELRVIREASAKLSRWRLHDTCLYTTLEPCVMCAAAIRTARVSRIVYGAPDIRLGGFGSYQSLHEATVFGPIPEIVSGVLEEESAELMRSFFRDRREEAKD